MHQNVSRVIDTLLSAFSIPAISQTQDKNIKTSLALLERLSIFLATEATATPELREQALRDYAALCPEIETLLRREGRPLDAVGQLARLGASGSAPDHETAMTAAKDVIQQLLDIPDAASTRRKLAMIEAEYCDRMWRARDEKIAASRAGSKAVVHTRDYNQEKLGAYIAKTFPEEKGVNLVESSFISGGYSKYTLGLRLANTTSIPERLILRSDSASSSAFGGVPVQQEYELLSVLYQHNVCVPRPFAYESTGEVFGSPFMLVEYRPGVVIGHQFELPPPNKFTCRDVAENLAKIHAVPLSELGCVRGAQRDTIDQVRDFLGESLANWRALGWPSALYEAAFDWLQRNIGVLERTRGLVHGDYA